MVGHTGSLAGWTLRGSVVLTATASGFSIGGFNISLLAGDTTGFAIMIDSDDAGSLRYTNATAVGDTAVSNSDLTIYEGYGSAGFGLTTFSPRIWNGTICYSLTNPCATTNTFAPMMTSGLYAGAGANDAETYYWGLSTGFIKANPSGGSGSYSYSWSNSAGYAMTGTSNMKARLFYPTGPTWVKVAITDLVEGCTVEDSVYIDWVDYTCNQPDIWFYEMCNINTNTSVCIAGTRNMRDSVKTGNYVFGPCAIATKAGALAQSELGVNVFPNPSNGNFTYIVMGDADATFNTQVMDINGRVLFTESFTSSSTISSRQISLQGFAAGVYVIKVSSNDASTVERIIIQ